MKCINPIIFKKLGKKLNANGMLVDDLQFYGHLNEFKKLNVDKNLFDNNYINFNGFVVVPCGRCINCRLSYAKHWADRLTSFGEVYDYKYFITLTYDDVAIQDTKLVFVNDDGSKIIGYFLVKNHLQKFFKSLRQYAKRNDLIEKEIKYYACGEYGEKNSRPHYHIIIYGFKIPDLVLEYRQNGFDYFQSDVISKLWKRGRIQVNNVSYESISYVARYCTKKQYGKDSAEYYFRKGVIPEFSVCSNGIGKKNFMDNYNDIYKNDDISIVRDGHVYHIKPFRYYDKLFDVIDSERMKYVKINRKSHYSSVLKHTDKYGYDYLQQLAVDNKNNIRKGV